MQHPPLITAAAPLARCPAALVPPAGMSSLEDGRRRLARALWAIVLLLAVLIEVWTVRVSAAQPLDSAPGPAPAFLQILPLPGWVGDPFHPTDAF